jgi:nucleotide-binding universal stress UspA family protein
VRYAAFTANMESRFRERLRTYIINIDAKAEQLPGGCSYFAQVSDAAASALVQHALKLKPSAICMSSRGNGRLRKQFGSLAWAMIDAGPVPVIMVPRRYRVRSIADVTFATESRTLSRDLRILTGFLEPLHCRIRVLHLAQSDINAHYRKTVRSIAGLGIHYVTRKRARGRRFAEEIRMDVRDTPPDLLALFNDGQTGWADRIFGLSEAKRVAFRPLVAFLILQRNG